MKYLSIYIFSAAVLLTILNLIFADKDSDGEAITSQFQNIKNETKVKENRKESSIFRRQLLNAIPKNTSIVAQNYDDDYFCKTGSKSGQRGDCKTNVSNSENSFQVSKNDTAKPVRKNCGKFRKGGCKPKKSPQRRTTDSDRGRYYRAATTDCKKQKGKKTPSDFDDESNDNYDLNDDDQDADYPDDENNDDYNLNDDDQDADYTDDEQDDTDIDDGANDFAEEDEDDNGYDDQDDITDLDGDNYDNYNDNAIPNINDKRKKGKRRRPSSNDYGGDDFLATEETTPETYEEEYGDEGNAFNDEVNEMGDDEDDEDEEGGNNDDAYDDDEDGLGGALEDDTYDDDEDGLGGALEDDDYDDNEDGMGGKTEDDNYDDDKYGIGGKTEDDNYDDDKDGIGGELKDDEGEYYNDGLGGGLKRTRGTKIPGGLGKYFVYVNCTTCKIKSQLVVLGGKKTSTLPEDEKAIR